MYKNLTLLLVLLSNCVFAVDLTPEVQEKIASHIDKLIAHGLKVKKIRPNDTITDEVFLRRAFLDIIGRIPTLNEYESFMSKRGPEKRSELIDQLFDTVGYVSHSYNYWADALRARPVKRTDMANYRHWIKKSIADNIPYDQFVREMIASEGSVHGKGNGAVGYYMVDMGMPLDNLANTMQLFLGTSMVCAQCHDYPYKKWSQMDFYKLAAFSGGTFTNGDGIDEKLNGMMTRHKNRDQKIALRPLFQGVYNSGTGKIKLPEDYSYSDGKPNEEIHAGVPYAPEVKIDYHSTNGAKERVFKFKIDRKNGIPQNVNSRKTFSEWITSRENPMFTKTIVNRLWDRIWGVPLVGNLLDMKESAMGLNPPLTQFLIKTMRILQYDTKAFMKIIYKTQHYQKAVSHEVTGKYYFQGPVMKRLKSEQIWDSLLSIRTNNPEEKVILKEVLPVNLFHEHLASLNFKQLVDYRNNSKTEQKKILSKNNYVTTRRIRESFDVRASEWSYPTEPGTMLQAFGASDRSSIDGSIQEANVPQALAMMNDDKYSFGRSALAQSLRSAGSMSEKIEMVYKAVLTRKPTSKEKSIISNYTNNDGNIESVYWALLNSHEFKLRN